MDGEGEYWQISSKPNGALARPMRHPGKHDGESYDLVGSHQRGKRVHVYSGATNWVANGTSSSVSTSYHAGPVQHPHLDGVFRAQVC